MGKRLQSRPHFEITKDGSPYLTRWWLSPSDEQRYHSRKHRPALLLHRIHREDADRDPHSHPWWFVSLVIKGSYVESIYDERGDYSSTVIRKRWSLAHRNTKIFHQIIDVSDDLWTLVLVGPKKKSWGFMTEKGFVNWERYFAEGWDVRGM